MMIISQPVSQIIRQKSSIVCGRGPEGRERERERDRDRERERQRQRKREKETEK